MMCFVECMNYEFGCLRGHGVKPLWSPILDFRYIYLNNNLLHGFKPCKMYAPRLEQPPHNYKYHVDDTIWKLNA